MFLEQLVDGESLPKVDHGDAVSPKQNPYRKATCLAAAMSGIATMCTMISTSGALSLLTSEVFRKLLNRSLLGHWALYDSYKGQHVCFCHSKVSSETFEGSLYNRIRGLQWNSRGGVPTKVNYFKPYTLCVYR